MVMTFFFLTWSHNNIYNAIWGSEFYN